MAVFQYEKNQVISTAGQAISELLLILKGSVSVKYPGGEYVLVKGDVIGICDASSSVYLLSYEALEDTSVMPYTYSGIESLEALLRSNADMGSLFSLSAFKQINLLLTNYDLLELECSNLYNMCTDYYAKYVTICNRNLVPPLSLALFENFVPFDKDTPYENWVPPYYAGIYQLFSAGCAQMVSKAPSVSLGFIGKASQDALLVLDSFTSIEKYKTNIYLLFMNTDFDDFFELFTSLYNKLDSTSPDALTLFGDIKHMISLLQNTNHLNSDFFTIRTSDFNRQASSLEATTATDDTLSVNAAKYKLELSNSLSTILTYSDVDQETAKAFTNCVQAYKNLSDKNQTDAAATAIYHKATELFNLIYQKVFERSLELPGLSMPVKLFLYFGFVDEELAGDENCAYLSSLADSMEENKVSGIFTLYSWLQSIYQGEREPSRNQFEVDYKEYVHSLKVAQKITEAQERVMMADQFKKVGYELENMFPIVNKITHGQLSTFCPFFSSHRIIRPLNTCYVSPLVIKKVLEKISDLDYTAFYRETIYTNEALNIPREFIHVEYLPNFILMPNIGSRSVMWQEIEGRKRTTPARMMLSIFSLEDVESSILHLVGEYRWEICKRVQGPRWNDVTDRSLTSEYFDYVQYFRKNSELSADAKEKIKNALKKSKNSFREMFVRDYMTWVTFESAGSPRLNKIARGILFTYCPFRKEVRASLASNPLYKELSDKYEFKAKQHLHRYQLIEQKLKNSNTPLPSELKKEIKYIEG